MSNLVSKIISTTIFSLGLLALSTVLIAKQSTSDHPPKDLGVINEERIIYWLKERGELKHNATLKEQEEAINSYIGKSKSTVDYQQKSLLPKVELVKSSKSITKNGIPKTVKVLSVLVDFSDLAFDNNGLASGNTDMYYDDYSVEHYRTMMFSTNGYTGPSGQTLKTAYQYYQEQTNNEFFFTGDVFGWVTADNGFAFYGENDPDNNDSDKNATTLVQEAVEKAVAQFNIDLTEYDVEDPFDRDRDNNFQEPDGFIDHVNIFHSSIGEEAGGGPTAGEDAIWSHRFFVNQTGNFNTMGYEIPGSGLRVFGYTIQPIDAAIGVVVHEFGHDLGLPDEYDIDSSRPGAPTGMWSVMAGGSWAGSPRGSDPVSFSTYARQELQARHGTSWLTATEINFEDLLNAPQTVDLVEAVNHQSGVNQVKINLPEPQIVFGAPFAGSGQYYSESGNDLRTELTFNLDIPDEAGVTLAMKARWAIEQDWDYVQMLVNDVAIAGSHTTATNPQAAQFSQYADSINYISGRSLELSDAQGNLGWIDLSYSMEAYRGQNVEIKFFYYTDTNTVEYGFVFDELQLTANGNVSYSNGAEVADQVTLNGFSRIGESRPGLPQSYLVQLRSRNGSDSGLTGQSYEPGVLVWFRNENYSDNIMADHAGYGFIGVVDADQNLIINTDTTRQVRDATFSLFGQASVPGDNNLVNNSLFKDTDDYSSPNKPQSGLVLPTNGLTLEVIAQANDSSTATIRLSAESIAITAGFSTSVDERTVTLTNSTTGNGQVLSYSWDFGDGSNALTEIAPSYTYSADGVFDITLTVTNEDLETDVIAKIVSINTSPNAGFTVQTNDKVATFSNSSSGGIGSLTYAWDFGDGSSSTDQAPTHTYAVDGNYSVQLVITDGEARTSTISKNVAISTAPAPGGGGSSSSSDSGGGGGASWLLMIALLSFYRKKR